MTARCTLRPITALAPLHGVAQAPLSRIVGGVDSLHPHKRPQRRLHLEQLPARGCGLGGHAQRVPLSNSSRTITRNGATRRCKVARAQVPSRTLCHHSKSRLLASSNRPPTAAPTPARSILA